MCTQETMAKAIEQYIEDEYTLFGELNTGYKIWYKESVEGNTFATNQSNVGPTIMSNKTESNINSETNTNSETKQEKTMDNGQQQTNNPGAMEKTKGFFTNLWDNHSKKIMFVAGIVTGASAAVGGEALYDRYTSTSGSEQA